MQCVLSLSNQTCLCNEKGNPEGKDDRMNMEKRRKLGYSARRGAVKPKM